MKRISVAVVITVCGWMLCLAGAARAQQPYRLTQKEMKALLERIEKGAERFRGSLDKMLDASYLNGTKAEDNLNDYIKEFRAATDHLRDRFDNDHSAAADVEEVLRRAGRIDEFMTRDSIPSRAREDWAMLRRDLDELAAAYNVAWSWEGVSNRPFRLNDEQVKGLLARVETDADRFRKSLNDALDKTRFNGTSAEDDINSFVREFEHATDRLKDHFSKKQAAAGDAEEVLHRAARIDAFMRQHELTVRAQEDWMRLREGLDELGAAYGVSWKWM